MGKFKLYHVSQKYLGKEVVLTPRIPPGQSVEELRSRYAKVPRICCSDTIERCLLGITKLKIQKLMYVYEPVGNYQVDWDSPRHATSDWDITDECWIVEQCKFRFVGTIKCDTNIFDPEVKYKKLRRFKMKCPCGQEMLEYRGALVCPDCNADTVNHDDVSDPLDEHDPKSEAEAYAEMEERSELYKRGN